MLRKFRRFVAYLTLKSLIWIAELLPRRVGGSWFAGLGGLAYSLFPGLRDVALANLKLVYGRSLSDEDQAGIARESFSNLARVCYDFARMRKQTRESVEELVEVEGLHHLDEALARGKGVIAITGHIGNWELMGAFLSLKGYPVNVLATRMRNERANRALVGLRKSAGVKVMERSSELMGAVRSLRRGEVLGVLIDLDTSVESVVVDFLGKPAKTASGYVKLAAATGAAIVPMAMPMTSSGSYELKIHEPVSIAGNGDSLEADVQKCSKAVEEFIWQKPTQWIWMHKRWKSTCSEIYA